jgi:MFS family permease
MRPGTLRRSLTFGIAGGLFGGAFWVVLFFLFGLAEEIHTAAFWGFVFGAAVFWFVVGLLIGALADFSSSPQVLAIDNSLPPSPLLTRAFRSFGRFLSRLLVGCFVGMIVTGIWELISFGLMFTDFFDKLKQTLLGLALGYGLLGSYAAGFPGALFAALFARNRLPGRRLRIGKWVVLGNVLGLFFGAYLAAGSGIITAGFVGMDEFKKNEKLMYLPMGVGLVAGTLAGLLAAACSALLVRPPRASCDEGVSTPP